MSPRVLVTGATGFVGLQIVSALAEESIEVIAVVRSGSETKARSLPGVVGVYTTPDLFQEGPDWWCKICSSVQIVIHAAWYLEPGKYLDSAKNIDCQIGTLNLARGAVLAGVCKIVGIGTCFEYDLTLGVVSSRTPLMPVSLYAAAKASVYHSLSNWLPQMSVEFAWCRLFYLYGQGEDPRRLVQYIRMQLANGRVAELSSGNQIRDYMDVKDAGKAIVKIAIGNRTGPINICSGNPITIRQMAEKIADVYGRRDLLNFGSRPPRTAAGDPPCVVGLVE